MYLKMKLLLLFLLIAGTTSATTFDLLKAPDYFENFISKFNKHYPDTETRNYRFKIFKQNLEEINNKNKLNNSAVYSINKFSDLTKNEIVSKYTGLTSAVTAQNLQVGSNFCKIVYLDSPPGDNLPINFDWRISNKVTSVKDQGACGSCWAFSALGSLESLYAIKHNKLINFSEQQLIDCDRVNMGCDGGLMHVAFEQIMNVGGVMEENDYPYRGVKSRCAADPSKFVVSLSSCSRYIFQNEDTLKNVLITQGPIAMAIDATSISTYSKGIIKFCDNFGVNHAVLLVGYGTENNVNYWTFKNTWGTDWGEDGYFRVKRNINSCGLVNELASTASIK
ncbi:cathepsin [Cryptophlebia peltastica nucleopolyhedrovirus]|uniref:Viral cathepsin n=1 Tax=Cryptophlebia peltastica nucleopolyhedrovirus TaxID=2304025 RepID=A0A346RNS1_9ABAC|nr:cathepsin [Cryptophlebia peltastica nucleopolyhedrovirus]AXS67718.1 cathepsin [Cryptophlebia peltastica nucleopolyhedrovirus]